VIYDVGDQVTVTTTVLVANVPTDATVTVTITAPDGTTSAPAVSHTGTGQYAATFTATMAGNYLVHWAAAGAAVGVDEYQLYVQPAGFRIVSLRDAKDYLRKTAAFTGDDNELREFIDSAGEVVDYLAGPTVNRSITEYYSGPAVELFLRQWPAASVTSVTEVWPGGPTYTLTQESALGVGGSGYDFTFDPQAGSITRRVNGFSYPFPPGDSNIKVVYVAGRVQPWPAKIRLGALEQISYLWRTSQTGRGAGRAATGTGTEDTVTIAGLGSVPLRVVEMLAGLKPPQAGA
jgi:hypothetical protein